MKKIDIPKNVLNIQNSMKKHSPEILTGLGIAGMISTTVMAVKSTPKAMILLDERSEILAELEIYEMSISEKIKTTWKCYIPSVIVGSASIACLISANSVNLRRNAAIATAYSLSESALKEYQEKVIETIGNKKEQIVRDAVAKEKISKDPVSNKEVIITNSGNTLCYDAISGRYFEADIDKIKKAINELNRNMLDEMYISLNDFYYEIGLKNIPLGDELGWNIANGLIDISYSSQLSENDRPCLVINYMITPKYDFNKNY